MSIRFGIFEEKWIFKNKIPIFLFKTRQIINLFFMNGIRFRVIRASPEYKYKLQNTKCVFAKSGCSPLCGST